MNTILYIFLIAFAVIGAVQTVSTVISWLMSDKTDMRLIAFMRAGDNTDDNCERAVRAICRSLENSAVTPEKCSLYIIDNNRTEPAEQYLDDLDYTGIDVKTCNLTEIPYIIETAFRIPHS